MSSEGGPLHERNPAYQRLLHERSSLERARYSPQVQRRIEEVETELDRLEREDRT